MKYKGEKDFDDYYKDLGYNRKLRKALKMFAREIDRTQEWPKPWKGKYLP